MTTSALTGGSARPRQRLPPRRMGGIIGARDALSMTTDSYFELPGPAEVARLAIQELEQRGGRCEVRSLREHVAAHIAMPEADKRKRRKRRRWEREVSRNISWAMTMLVVLDEVDRLPATTEQPWESYELVAREDPLTEDERRRRRREWFEAIREYEDKRQWD